MNDFEEEVLGRVDSNGNNIKLRSASNQFTLESIYAKYSYNYSWLGRPIIQYPTDIVVMQEIIWKVKPDLIIETGIAHGGSLIFSASMLALLDLLESFQTGQNLDKSNLKRKVIGVDIDIRKHNLKAIEEHPLFPYIQMLEGSSISSDIINKVKEFSKGYKNILVCLDSSHTHSHVLQELEAYAPLTSKNSYCVVFDTIIEDLPKGTISDRPWDKGDNAKTAVWEYLKILKTEKRNSYDGEKLTFEIDKYYENKTLITMAPDGFLKRI